MSTVKGELIMIYKQLDGLTNAYRATIDYSFIWMFLIFYKQKL